MSESTRGRSLWALLIAIPVALLTGFCLKASGYEGRIVVRASILVGLGTAGFLLACVGLMRRMSKAGSSGSDPNVFDSTENGGDSEESVCLSCGVKIPATQNSCPSCGWSYRGN